MAFPPYHMDTMSDGTRAEWLVDNFPVGVEHMVLGYKESPILRQLNHPLTFDARSDPSKEFKVIPN